MELDYFKFFLAGSYRRAGWLLQNSSVEKMANLSTLGWAYTRKQTAGSGWPAVLKIDISPHCSLRCPSCVHADPAQYPAVANQKFKPNQRMSVEQFGRIIDEVRGHTSAVSLYYLGDPYNHPNIDLFCRIAADAELNVHTSTHFSVPLKEERIASIAHSGVTHLTVCVDGLTQETYGRTRVGGQIDRVLDNLERLCSYKKQRGLTNPKIEVQYIKYQHNLHQLAEARRLFERFGIDHVTEFWGALHNVMDSHAGTYTLFGPKKRQLLPLCPWPFFSMLIKYNGDVIPCCFYRLGEQYTGEGTPRSLGNVFSSSVRKVWQSRAIERNRLLTTDPGQVEKDPSLKDIFCHGCRVIFESDAFDRHRRSNRFDIDS